MVTYRVKDLDEFIKLADEISNQSNELIRYIDRMGEVLANVASYDQNQDLGATETVYNLSELLNTLRGHIEQSEPGKALSSNVSDVVNDIDNQLDQLEEFRNPSISNYLQELTLIFANSIKPKLNQYLTGPSEISGYSEYTDPHGNVWYYSYGTDQDNNAIFILDKHNPKSNERLFDFYSKYLTQDVYDDFATEEHVHSFIRNIIRMFNEDKSRSEKPINKVLAKIEDAARYRIEDFKSIDKKSKEETEQLIIKFLNQYIESPDITEGISSEEFEKIKSNVPNYAKRLIDKYY